MEDVKYQIFISSTFLDLESVRSKISATILNLQHFPIGMEMFSAGDSEQWEIITETIDVSDYYLLIIGHRYGSVTNEGISYTEKEFDYAISKGIPVLSFIRERNIPTLAAERENDPDKNLRLEAFIAKAKNGKMCEFWETPDELATKVAVALPKTFKRTPRLGWKRTQVDNSKEILAELTHLSTENRELRRKVSEYEALQVESLPIIEVTLNNSQEIYLTAAVLSDEICLHPPSALSISEIEQPYRHFVTEEDIVDYNNNLPTQERYDEYLNGLKKYRSANLPEAVLNINTRNAGSMRANDIYITIKFPSFVEVFEKSAISKIPQPKPPVPISPVIAAQKKYSRTMAASIFDTVPYFSVIAPNPDLISSSTLRNLNIHHNSEIKDNSLHVYHKSLMHTRETDYASGEFIIVPISAGTGFIEITIICEQYKSETIEHIPITATM